MKTLKIIAGTGIAIAMYGCYTLGQLITLTNASLKTAQNTRQAFAATSDSILADSKATLHTICFEYQTESNRIYRSQKLSARQKQAALSHLRAKRAAKTDSLHQATHQELTATYNKARRRIDIADSVVRAQYGAILPQKLVRSLSR